MTLDPDLMRAILLHIETAQDNGSWQYQIDSDEDYFRYYAATKLLEAGYLNATIYEGIGASEVIDISSLTFSGHQFLEAARSPGAWSYAKTGASKLANFSVDVLMEFGKAYAKDQLSKCLGGAL